MGNFECTPAESKMSEGSSHTRSKPGVFLDRDGTIIEDRGHLGRPSEVVFFPDTIEALQRLQEKFTLFIVTNQSGVAKGILHLNDVERVNAYITAHLAEAGIKVAAVYVCPHQRTDGCACIKPKPFFLEKAKKEHGINLAHSFVVGDHPHDVEFARNVGARGVYVLTGHGKHHNTSAVPADVILPGIREAATWILSEASELGDENT